MKNKKNKLSINKFHFNDNGLLRKIRSKAAPVNPELVKAGKAAAKKTSGKPQPKSILSKLPARRLRRLIEE
jgi:hypothetical protein